MRARFALSRVVAIALALCSLSVTPSLRVVKEPLPQRLDDRAFWAIASDFSEDGGYFRSDNLVSNETAFQQVIPTLQRRIGPAGAYLGVGPDQNFTYIVALKPRIAFIVDIRHQNMLLHLLYKALIEVSPTRNEFISRLFSRKRPRELTAAATAEEMFAAYERVAPDAKYFDANLKDVVRQLTRRHGFALTSEDLQTIEQIYRAFLASGPDIAYSFPRGGWMRFPTYRELMTETDGQGGHRSYIATEQNYQVLREFQRNNLIVPVTGDFSGRKALRSVAAYLRDHGVLVTAFYTSNVEQYLFRGTEWQQFYDNVAQMPIDGESTFIRAAFSNFGYYYPSQASGLQSATLLNPISALLAAYREGRIRGYADVIEMSR